MRDNDTHTDDQWRWHMQAITDTITQWRDGHLTTQQKRRAIADENQRYYGDQAESWMTRTGRRYEAPAILAEAAGVDEDVMVIALNQYRDSGRQAFADVLDAALGRQR